MAWCTATQAEDADPDGDAPSANLSDWVSASSSVEAQHRSGWRQTVARATRVLTLGCEVDSGKLTIAAAGDQRWRWAAGDPSLDS